MGDNVYWYITDGVNPEPWESPEGSIQRKSGKMYVQMHKPLKLRAFQEDLAETFLDQNPDTMLLDGPVRMEIYLWRHVDRLIKANIADATNMQKAIEDALQGILYANDRQVIDVRTRIMAQGPEAKPAIVVAIATDVEWGVHAWTADYATKLLEMKRAAATRLIPHELDKRRIEPGDSFF